MDARKAKAEAEQRGTDSSKKFKKWVSSIGFVGITFIFAVWFLHDAHKRIHEKKHHHQVEDVAQNPPAQRVVKEVLIPIQVPNPAPTTAPTKESAPAPATEAAPAQPTQAEHDASDCGDEYDTLQSCVINTPTMVYKKSDAPGGWHCWLADHPTKELWFDSAHPNGVDSAVEKPGKDGADKWLYIPQTPLPTRLWYVTAPDCAQVNVR